MGPVNWLRERVHATRPEETWWEGERSLKLSSDKGRACYSNSPEKLVFHLGHLQKEARSGVNKT